MSPSVTLFVLFLILSGGCTFLPAASRILAHDDGTNRVMIQAGTGFGLVVAGAMIALWYMWI